MGRNRYPTDDEEGYEGESNPTRLILFAGIILLVLAAVGLLAVTVFGVGQPSNITPTAAAPADDGINEIRNLTPQVAAVGSVTPVAAGSGATYKGDWYDLAFTQPVYPDNPQQRPNSLNNFLVNFMNLSKKTLDVAIYDFDLGNVADAMVRAKQRGVRVRMVTDTDTLNNKDEKIQAAFDKLKKAEIPIVDDNRSAIMHNKFTVVDNERVSTGSWNYTEGDTFRLNNNVIFINLPQIAQNYTATFEKMFTKKEFGPKRPSGVPFPILQVGNSKIETYFSPEDDNVKKISDRIRTAQSSIYFMAFSFTQDDIARAMLDRARAGVKVGGVFEKTGSQTTYSEYTKMQAAKLPTVEVYTDGNPYVMHHKVIILDEKTVIFGSFNFSDNAAKSNDENLLIVEDAGLAKAFKEEYDRVLALAKSANPAQATPAAPAGTPKP